MQRTKLAQKSKNPANVALRKKKAKAETITKLKAKLWQLCRTIIKQQYGNVCFTCGLQGLEKSNYQIGHFIASSICSTELRYSLDNLRPQCAACNIWKSGNWLAFENHLLQEKGEVFVHTLKKRNEETKGLKYGSQWIKDKIIEYERVIAEYEKLAN